MDFKEALPMVVDLEEYDPNNPEFYLRMVIDPGQPHSLVLDQSYMEKLLVVHFKTLSWEHEEMKREIQEEMKSVKSQTEGYINPNWQKNIGRANMPEDGSKKVGGAFFNMECLYCHHVYASRSSSLKAKKCPNCQGGRA